MFTCSIVLLALFASVQGRAVNISNTWVLPEEGFPVFYRYFRDRISWYEADAVCQFHHANLVTVDTTAQYDAVRAYLKELDISSAVWVGLIRSNPDGDFTWTDYRGLSGEGYWSAAPDARAAPLCAAADPSADYRWEARACGGPTVASFICELPVPQWALGNEGCMVRALPALTILYLPESAAVQLTADCGLAGVKKVQCTGNVKRENLLKNLSCNEEDDLSTLNPVSGGSSAWTSSDFAFNITNDQEAISELSTELDLTTEHISETATSTQVPTVDLQKHQSVISKVSNNYIQKNIHLDLIHNNNLQSNDIPKLAGNENFLTLEQTEKLEDEKLIHHKMLHDELARHGNFETIFTQPTDHFVPPLVMAKAKISDDMTVLSLAEKHAQQLAEQQRFVKHNSLINEHSLLDAKKNIEKSTTEEPHKIEIVDKPLIMTFESVNLKNTLKKDKIKTSLPKKYKEKYDDPKGKNMKLDGKLAKFEKFTDKSTTLGDITSRVTESTATTTEMTDIKNKEDPIELKVILKEPKAMKTMTTHNLISETSTPAIVTTTETITTMTPEITKHTSDFVTTEKEKSTDTSETATTVGQTENLSSGEIVTDIVNKSKVEALKDIIDLNHEIIKITIVNDDNKLSPTQTVYVLTTSTPELKGTEKSNDKLNSLNNEQSSTSATSKDVTINNNTVNPSVTTSTPNEKTASPITETVNVSDSITIKADNTSYTTIITTQTQTISSATSALQNQVNKTKNASIQNTSPLTTTPDPAVDDKTETYNISEIYDADSERDDKEAIDDFNSPLLSGANEPAYRPNRSRRPKPPSRLNKFNPFRILG